MIYVVEVLAIYEDPGVNPSNQRTNQRDNDLSKAGAVSDKYEPGGVAPEDEYLAVTEARYGFGWKGRQFITVQKTASDLGTAIYNQLVGRNLKAGSKVLVFSDLRDEGQTNTTSDPLFARYWPRANPPQPDIG